MTKKNDDCPDIQVDLSGVKAINPDIKVTSYEDLIAAYRTSFLRLTSEKMFEIRSIVVDNILIPEALPVVSIMAEEGVDLGDIDAIAERLREMILNKEYDSVQHQAILRLARITICAGITSVNFVDKDFDDCDPEKKEMPVSILSVQELLEINIAVMTLSNPELEAKTLYWFTTEGQIGEGDPDQQDE